MTIETLTRISILAYHVCRCNICGKHCNSSNLARVQEWRGEHPHHTPPTTSPVYYIGKCAVCGDVFSHEVHKFVERWQAQHICPNTR